MNYPLNPQINPQLEQLQQLYNQLQNLNKPPQGLDSLDATVPPIQWVKGIEGGRAAKLKPNTTAALFDENEAVFYLRSVDANGVESPMKVGRFTLEDPPVPEDNTVTKKDFEAFKSDIMQLLANQNKPQQRVFQNNQNQQNQEVKK